MPLGPRLLLATLAATSGAALATEGGPEATVWVQVEEPADLELVADLGLGWDEATREVGGAHQVRFRLPASRLDDLDRSGLSWELTPAELAPEDARRPSEYLDALELLADSAPELVTLVELGQSVEGRPLVGVRLRGGASPEVQVRVLGGHHGDEHVSAEVALDLAQRLVAGWTEGDPDVGELLDRTEVFIQPVVNPDGIAADTRSNARSVDLNRNYDYQWSSASYRPGEAAFSEPETRAVRTWAAWSSFGSGLSLHSGALNLGWVWNYTTEPTDEADLLELIAQDYADHFTASELWITNGADWYVTHGDTTDWSYGRYGTLDYTLEVSERKAPPADEVVEVAAAHWPGLAAFLSWPEQLTLQVFDEETGQGLPAEVLVAASDRSTWSGPDGRWARPSLGAEAEVLEIFRSGYEAQVLNLDPSEPSVEVALRPSSLASWSPSPRLLSRSEAGELLLPETVGAARLTRPGEDAQTLGSLGAGLWNVDLERLSPGPWTLETDQGVVPRGVFVGELDDLAWLGTAALVMDEDTGAHVVIEGGNLGAGSRVFALWGASRAPVELELISETDEVLEADAAVLESTELEVDLLVLTRGRQLALLDLNGSSQVDTGAPQDTGTVDSGQGQQDTSRPGGSSGGAGGGGAEPRACGCTSSAPTPGYLALLGLLCLAGTRSRRRQP